MVKPSSLKLSLSLSHGLSVLSLSLHRPKTKNPKLPPKSKMSKLLIFLTLIPLLPILTTSFSPENRSSRRVLVLLDDLALKSSHSVFFNSLQSRGFHFNFNINWDEWRLIVFISNCTCIFSAHKHGLRLE